MRTYDVDGHQVQLLATQDTGLWITDTWEDLDRPVGDVFRVGNVLTVRPGVTYATALPIIPYGSVYATGCETDSASDPLGASRRRWARSDCGQRSG